MNQVNLCKKHKKEIKVWISQQTNHSAKNNYFKMSCTHPKQAIHITLDNAVEIKNIKSEFSLKMEEQNNKNQDKIITLLQDVVKIKTTMDQQFRKLIDNIQHWITNVEELNVFIKRKICELSTLNVEEFEKQFIQLQENNQDHFEIGPDPLKSFFNNLIISDRNIIFVLSNYLSNFNDPKEAYNELLAVCGEEPVLLKNKMFALLKRTLFNYLTQNKQQYYKGEKKLFQKQKQYNEVALEQVEIGFVQIYASIFEEEGLNEIIDQFNIRYLIHHLCFVEQANLTLIQFNAKDNKLRMKLLRDSKNCSKQYFMLKRFIM